MDERQKYQAMSKTTALLQGRGYLVGEGVIGMAGRSQWPVAYPNGTMVGYLMIDNPYHLFLLSGETVEACNVPDQRPAVPAQAANPYLRGPQAPTGRTSHHAQMNPHMRPQRQAPPPVTPSNYQFNSYTGAWEPTVPPMQYGHGQPQEVYPYLQGSQAPPAQMESHMSSQRQVPPSVPPARPQFNPYTRAWETAASPMQYGYRQPQPATSSLGHNYQPRHRRPDARQNLPSQTRAPSVYGPDQSNQQTDSRRPTVRPSHPQARTGQGNPRASTRGPTQGPVSQPSVPKQRQPVHTPVSGSGQPNLDTRTTNPTGAKPTRARWQSGLRGALAAWPVALVTTSGISREINAWAPGRQKVFSGYLGVLRLVSREDEELSNALAHLLTKASAVTELFRVENIFGSGTVFVSSDGSSHPFNPSTWPILTRAALKAYSGNGWQVDDKTGCIHVNEELDKAKFVTSRFYNKLRQEVCYAYTCNTSKSSPRKSAWTT
ncbi:hypothetical protein HDE_03487 [Halotydeus destructor]|nr:hypothetical protein HDE_03487 [Halotydeus destructor]